MGHAQISQNDLVRHLANFGNRLASVRGFSHRVTRALQRQSQDATQAFFVFDEKDIRHEVRTAGGSGRVADALWATRVHN